MGLALSLLGALWHTRRVDTLVNKAMVAASKAERISLHVSKVYNDMREQLGKVGYQVEKHEQELHEITHPEDTK